MGYVNGQHDNTCYFCHRDIPKYEHGGIIFDKGFVPPSPPRTEVGVLTREEQDHVKFKMLSTGVTAEAIEERCCRPCYLAEFRRIHPGAPIPDLPRPISNEELIAEVMAGNIVPETTTRARGTSTLAGVDEDR